VPAGIGAATSFITTRAKGAGVPRRYGTGCSARWAQSPVNQAISPPVSAPSGRLTRTPADDGAGVLVEPVRRKAWPDSCDAPPRQRRWARWDGDAQ
jgi:hypothetical protein